MAGMQGTVRGWMEAHALAVGIGGLVIGAVGIVVGVSAAGGAGPDAASADVAADISGTVVEVTTLESAPGGDDDEPGPASTAPAWVAVKIDNAPAARPQVGLEQAQMVVEVPVEGGLTRFLAWYEPDGAPELVGPVRSLRPVDADLLAPFSTVVISTGGQESVLRAARGAGLTPVGPDDSPGWEILERPSPHNLFVSVAAVADVLPTDPPAGFGIPTSDWPGGEPAETITIPFAEPVTWSFEEERYRRSTEGGPFEVLATHDGGGEQLTTDTVLVLHAAQRSAGYADVNGAEVPTFDVIGSGSLLAFSGGEVVEGTWSRSAQEDPFAFSTASGVSFGLPEGRVFLTVVPRELEIGY